MPDAAVVKIIIEHYGWPLVTVAVLIYIIYRTFGKHETQMSRITQVNEEIVINLKSLADLMARHDYEEDRRHRDTQSRLRP